MEDKVVLKRLPQELVNKIAAGEVVERPASVVKELVDNSIDAKATRIEVEIEMGGMKKIKVGDNGTGIPKENLEYIFDSHTTSKISTFEDLNSLLTMGFRGEALSTISSVSTVEISSKYINEEIGASVSLTSKNEKAVKSSAKEQGTVVVVENLFERVPARKKFLKSADTEYKKILEVLIPYFLIYPNIHFVLIKDGKKIFDLKEIPSSKEGDIDERRVKEVLSGEFVKNMLKVYSDGAGLKITGFVGHPSLHQKGSANQYLFVNRRPVRDSGVNRAIYQGFARYIPSGQRVPFILLLDIDSKLVDVNVHPRKEEVRFLNPFRVYIAVEQAVKKSLESATSYRKEASREPVMPLPKQYAPMDIYVGKRGKDSVQDSLLFTKEALAPSFSSKGLEEYIPQKEERLSVRDIFQIFNKYIVVEFSEDTLWVIDQHAAAERITFEKLKNRTGIERQKFLVPFEIILSTLEIEGMKQTKEFFNELGFEYELKGSKVLVSSTPVEFLDADFKKLFEEVFALTDDIENISNELERLREDIYATMACHTSVRSGQKLKREEMLDIYNSLVECKNPYSCPHGRPVVWKMSLSDIDMNFDRTY